MSDANRAASADQPLPVAEAMRRRAAPRGAPRPPRARPYLRLLWIIPGLALLGAGLYRHYDVEDDGTVHTIQVTTKPGMVGQASEALRLISVGTPDLYLKFKTADGAVTRTFTHEDTPVGNGLKWSLDKPLRMRDVREVEVWDEDAIRDNFADRVSLGSAWSAEGQAYRIDLLGERSQPPRWALPVAVAGGVVTLVVVLRFVWDQVI
jgi:hypothetical protein